VNPRFQDFLREIEAKHVPIERESPEISVFKKKKEVQNECKSNEPSPSYRYVGELQKTIEDMC